MPVSNKIFSNLKQNHNIENLKNMLNNKEKV